MSMKRLILSIFLLMVTLNMNRLFAQSQEGISKWKAQKYSMFIHWGIYSVLGGVWDGKNISRGLSEQIQSHAGIYSDTYAQTAKQFNPTRWNADSVVLLAKAAGMRSVVITSKHHDGFCMFQSAHTDFDIVDATPFKRDVLKELSDACKRHGLRFGVYFSLIDWRFPQASPISSHNSDFITPEHHEYNMKQVTELMTNYGTISEIWFDMGSQRSDQSKALRDLVHRLQPDCMVSSRLGNDMGDFTVMGDNQEPDYRIGVPWQSPASFFDETWGYRSWQERTNKEEKIRDKLTSLIRVVSRGGNYLLNIGPRGDGSVVDYERDVLLAIGEWLARNSEAIYGVDADPFQVSFDWGSITSKTDRLYLHIMKDPVNGVITLPGLHGKIKKAYVLDDQTPCKIGQGKGVTVTIPAAIHPTENIRVITIEFDGGYTVDPVRIVDENKGTFILKEDNAFHEYSNSSIDYNTRFRSTIAETWMLKPSAGGTYTPVITYTEQEKGKSIDLLLNKKLVTVSLTDGKPLKSAASGGNLSWSGFYTTGVFFSGIEGTHGDIRDIDVSKKWPSETGSSWILRADLKPGEVYQSPADMESAYYVLQEVNALRDQTLLIDITAGDGYVLFVNGKERFLHLNTDRDHTVKDVVSVELLAGKNQLLVKCFNNFRKNFTFAMTPSGNQTVFQKNLASVSLQRGKFYSVGLKPNNPATPHGPMLLPNVKIEVVKD